MADFVRKGNPRYAYELGVPVAQNDYNPTLYDKLCKILIDEGLSDRAQQLIRNIEHREPESLLPNKIRAYQALKHEDIELAKRELAPIIGLADDRHEKRSLTERLERDTSLSLPRPAHKLLLEHFVQNLARPALFNVKFAREEGRDHRYPEAFEQLKLGAANSLAKIQKDLKTVTSELLLSMAENFREVVGGSEGAGLPEKMLAFAEDLLPKNGVIAYGWGTVHMDRGDLDTALGNFEASRKDGNKELGNLRVLTKKIRDMELGHERDCLLMDCLKFRKTCTPRDPHVCHQLGELLLAGNYLEEALENFCEALKYSKKSEQAVSTRSLVKLAKQAESYGKTEIASKAWSKIGEVSSDNHRVYREEAAEIALY